jgi:hypothetical protein
MTGAILARTSGPACPRAEAMLGDLAEGVLPAAEAQLVRAHLEHCRACQALAVTLGWLLPELREMRELPPDPAFTAAVMRRTAPQLRRAALRHAWRGRFEGLAAWWRRQLTRPRFALEAAYVATLLVVALCGTPVSPFRDAPPRALEVVRASPAGISETLTGSYGALSGHAEALGRAAWGVSGAPVTAAARRTADGLTARLDRARPALSVFGDEVRRGGEAALDRNFVLALEHLRGASHALGRAWREWREPAGPAANAPVDTSSGAGEAAAAGPRDG